MIDSRGIERWWTVQHCVNPDCGDGSGSEWRGARVCPFCGQPGTPGGVAHFAGAANMRPPVDPWGTIE